QLVGARELDRVEAVELAQLGRRGPAAPQAAAGQQGQGDGEREQTNDGGVAHGGDRQPRSKRGIASLASGWPSSAMLPLRRLACVPLALALLACKAEPASTQPDPAPAEQPSADDSVESEFVWAVDRFADAQVLRYQVPGFEQLDLQRKQLLYYL